MTIQLLSSLAQTAAPQPETGGRTLLGFFILGIIFVLAIAVTYLLARRNTPSQTTTTQRCPTCNAPRRGEFCAKCGAKF